VLNLTKNIDAIVAKADQQTGDTREIFSIPNAMGVLVIVNENASMLDPEVIRYGLDNVFQKRCPDGALRYPHTDGVVLIPEAHPIKTPYGPRIPLMLFDNSQGRVTERFQRFGNELFEAWAKFNGVPLIRTGT
jgi:hypothetical protein